MAEKVLVVGATGTIGGAVAAELARDYTVIAASRTGDEQIDLSDLSSVETGIDRIGSAAGPLAGIIVCAGGGIVGAIEDLDLEAILPRLDTKLLGQVAVVRHGCRYVRPGGAIVLTSGMLEKHPLPGTSHLAIINSAIGGFVRASATELDSVRVCAVSPGLVIESPQKVLDLFEGMSRIPAAELAQVYRRALEEGKSGMTYDAFGS